MSWSSRTSLLALVVAGCGGTTVIAPDAGSDASSASPATHIVCGFSRACVLREDGSVSCWGEPTPDAPKGPFSKIGAGVPVCGLRTTGEMECWGWGTFDGAAIAGRFSALSINIQRGCATSLGGSTDCWSWNGGGGIESEKPSEPVTSVTAGDNRPCGLRTSDATPVCWGLNAISPAPQVPSKAVASSSDTACAIRADDSSVMCWGDLSSGAALTGPFAAILGSRGALCGIRPDGAVVCSSTILQYMKPGEPAGAFVDVCVGDQYGCGIHPDGTLSCWGLNFRGRTSPPAR